MLKHSKERLHAIHAQLCASAKPYLILVVLILTAMIPLLMANFNYLDDLGRTAIGYRLWDNYSRYISEYASVLVHAGTHLTDISPLPQMLAACIMAAASLMVIFCLKDEHRAISVFDLIAVLPLTLSPYFLECLSYKFDAPYMAFSVFASVFPVWVYTHCGRGIPFLISSMAGTLCMCLSYQAASGIYPMLIVWTAFSLWNLSLIHI